MSHCDIVTRVSRCDIVLETGEYGIHNSTTACTADYEPRSPGVC